MCPTLRDILHPVYYEILKALENDELTRTNIVSRVSFMSKSAVYLRLQKLVSWGLVEEKWVTENVKRPYKVYFLTERGRRVLEAMELIKETIEGSQSKT